MTATGQSMGSPFYMSPEQVRSAKNVNLRTDIWALGVIVHELLTKKAPFGGRLSGACLPPSSPTPPSRSACHGPTSPRGLERLIARCLEKEPARRYGSVGEVARDLALFAVRGAEALSRILQLTPDAPRSIDALASTALPTVPYVPPPTKVTPPPAMGASAGGSRGAASGADCALRQHGWRLGDDEAVSKRGDATQGSTGVHRGGRLPRARGDGVARAPDRDPGRLAWRWLLRKRR